MNNEFDDYQSRFSETASKILTDSKIIASTMDSGVGSEHVLAALTSTPGTIAYEALREIGVTPERISFVLNSAIKEKNDGNVSAELKLVLKNTYKLAHQFGSPSVDSEHLLLSLVSKKDCRAYQILKELDASPNLIRQQLEEYFEQLRRPAQAANRENEAENETDESEQEYFSQFPQDAPRQAPQRAKSAIDYFTTDLTKMAKAKKLDAVIGREKEIRRMVQVLIRRQKNNPVLTGDPGVGKTAVVEGLAQRIVLGEVPPQLVNKRILSLDLALLISGTTYRGQFEERTKKLVDEILRSGDVILFVDEIHTIVGAGAAEGSIDLSNILKPALTKGQLMLIGATTNDEYRKYVEKDPALERRFQRVNIDEPSVEETVLILKGLKPPYEKHHNVTIADDAITAAAEMGKRYINDRFLPDKAIDLIDEAAAATQLEEKQLKVSNQITDLEKRCHQAKTEHQKAADSLEYEKAAEWRVLELRLLNEIEKLKSKLPHREQNREITRHDVAKIVSMWTGIPMTSLERTDRVRLTNLRDSLKAHIVGQDEAIDTISSAIKRASTGVADPNRPLGTFIFLGPTGVGKTELAKVLAKEVFGRDEALVKIDMSEFMEKHNVSRLVGAPPGYVGYDEAGKLTETIRRQPYSVVLLDEIEKAHPDVFNMLLQIMEDGYLTDAKGRQINFRNTIIIMTSNIGMTELNQQASIGFKLGDEADLNKRYSILKDQILTQMKNNFRPEFLNRLDKIIVFKPLGKNEISDIVDRQVERLIKRLTPEGIEITVEDSAKKFIAEKGFDPEFGARPIRRAITDFIENPLSELLLTGKLNPKSPIRVLRRGEKLALVK